MPKLVIISGQSNAIGENNGGPNPAPAGVQIWNNSLSSWGSSNYTLSPLADAEPNGNGGNNNMGLALACRLNKETGEDIYLIQSCVDGGSITNWINGIGTAFTTLASLVASALSTPQLAGIDLTSDVVILWAQGEADSTLDYNTYNGYYNTLFSQLRAETWGGSTVPFLIFQPSLLHYVDAPVKVMWNYSKTDGWATFVSTEGLATSDGTHWTGPALWEIGYYRAYNALINTPDFHVIDPQFFSAVYSPQILCLPRTTVTPTTGGVLTTTNSSHSVDTPGAIASQDVISLSTTNIVDETVVILRAASSSRTIVMKNAATGGNLALAGSDFSLDNARDQIGLKFDSGVGLWLELFRSNNGA